MRNMFWKCYYTSRKAVFSVAVSETYELGDLISFEGMNNPFMVEGIKVTLGIEEGASNSYQFTLRSCL